LCVVNTSATVEVDDTLNSGAAPICQTSSIPGYQIKSVKFRHLFIDSDNS